MRVTVIIHSERTRGILLVFPGRRIQHLNQFVLREGRQRRHAFLTTPGHRNRSSAARKSAGASQLTVLWLSPHVDERYAVGRRAVDLSKAETSIEPASLFTVCLEVGGLAFRIHIFAEPL